MSCTGMSEISYQRETHLDPIEFIDILNRSSLAERRPVKDSAKIEAMCDHGNLVVTARDEGKLVGVSRSLTDFLYVCYLSDLAVDESYQKQGIGKRLIEETQAQLGSGCRLLLLAAPKAKDYYAHIGFRHLENAWAKP
jgi:predicted N-acetyltransferase YhbS